MSVLQEGNPVCALTAGDIGGQYLTFRIAGEEYGIAIRHVHEIIGTLPTAHIPRVPDFVRGVINLRGKIIPIIDMRLRLAMESKEDTDKSCIIVVDVRGRNGKVTMGFVADEVSEVLDITSSEIEDAPEFGAQFDTAFLLGIAKVKGQVKILIDINKILGGDEISQLSNLA
ncbi:MAG: purine-binding chemotaxis protein CheW [Candidatus Hydrogenedentes bacterium]|nr:purine-binding chemotaxis protein CheW [Candidatus Hydrogenedentota bacterium]